MTNRPDPSHAQVAAAADAGRQRAEAAGDRDLAADMAGSHAVLALAARGVVDPDELRAASRAARARQSA